MFNAILALLSNLSSIAASLLGMQSKKLELRNAPDMKDSAERHDEQAAVDKTETAIAKGDIDEIRKEISE
jgi:hypothetical protein